MRRFSIRNLMALVLAIAVGFAALKGANDYWAGGLMLATLVLLGCSILGAIHGRGRARAAWLGFLVMGGGYFLAIRTLPDLDAARLPTSKLLAYAIGQFTSPEAITVNLTPGGTITNTATTSTIAGLAPAPGVWDTILYSPQSPSPNYLRTWNGAPLRIWPLSTADGEVFASVGHGLFALLAGWLGAVLSARLRPRDEGPIEEGR